MPGFPKKSLKQGGNMALAGNKQKQKKPPLRKVTFKLHGNREQDKRKFSSSGGGKEKSKVTFKSEQKVPMKLRIIYPDPDATDDSSDEEDEKRIRYNNGIKCQVKEIRLYRTVRGVNSATKSPPETKKPDCRPAAAERRTPSSMYKGVRKRPSGNWAAEIRDPITKKRTWLGTFISEEAAHEAYQRKEKEFELLQKLSNGLAAFFPSQPFTSAASEETPGAVCSHSSVSSIVEDGGNGHSVRQEITGKEEVMIEQEVNGKTEEPLEQEIAAEARVKWDQDGYKSSKEPITAPPSSEPERKSCSLNDWFVGDNVTGFFDQLTVDDFPECDLVNFEAPLDLPIFDIDMTSDELAWIDEALNL